MKRSPKSISDVLDVGADDNLQIGPGSAGQSGDNQGLSDVEGATSQSVAELLEEGQAWEAGVVNGIENAPNANESRVRTKEVPEDDVPPEYDERSTDTDRA